MEEVHLAGAVREVELLAGVGLEEAGPVEVALGPTGLGAGPRVGEARVVHVDLEDPEDPRDPTLRLVSSYEDPSLGVPWGPSLVVVAHVDPKTQVEVVHGGPSLQEEEASPHKGPCQDEEGPNVDLVDPTLDLDPSLRSAARSRIGLVLRMQQLAASGYHYRLSGDTSTKPTACSFIGVVQRETVSPGVGSQLYSLLVYIMLTAAALSLKLTEANQS